MSVEQRSVWVETSFVGWHHWPGAPPARAYLSAPHRHKFGVRVEVPVDHDDRELEFHDLLDLVRQQLPSGDLGPMSCEMIAEALAQDLREQLSRSVIVGVDEDGECGAYVELSYP